jgi:hypothetical protein|tara:strand:+ start:138 stop:308 length:171 start_codon:yes stop_codon:yes gene_type:complete
MQAAALLKLSALEDNWPEPLKQLPIGLEETDDGIWSLYFNHLLRGKIDERDMVFRG